MNRSSMATLSIVLDLFHTHARENGRYLTQFNNKPISLENSKRKASTEKATNTFGYTAIEDWTRVVWLSTDTLCV